MEKSGLIIAPTFFCPSDAVGQIERHFFPNLSNDYRIHLLCSNKYDMNFNSSKLDIYSISQSLIIDKLDLVFRRLKLRDLIYSPDSLYYSWGKRAYKKGLEIIEKKEIDYIHTINNPVSSHLIGYKLKKTTGIPWVAHMFDPWHNNPFRKYKFNYFEKKDSKREKLVADSSDLILFPNQELLDSWIDIYGEKIKNKSAVLPFVTEIPEVKNYKKKDNTLTISHIGTLSADRRADVFLASLAKLKKESPDLASKLKVNIVGYITDQDKYIIERDKLDDIVNVVGHVSEAECIDYYEQSDLFLIIDINCNPNLFYPSKLLKYFCYKKPILGITREESVVANELKKTNNHVFGYNDVGGISQFIRVAILNYDTISQNDHDYCHRFSVENVTKLYDQLINKILDK